MTAEKYEVFYINYCCEFDGLEGAVVTRSEIVSAAELPATLQAAKKRGFPTLQLYTKPHVIIDITPKKPKPRS